MLLGHVVLITQEEAQSVATHPDIILLILDTLRADRLSCYGYPLETSPHLDALAAESTFFRHAVSAAHWTVPSHTSMFTGLYPSRHMTLHASSKVPASIPTLAERLRDSGYYTTAYCNNPLVGVVNNGLRRGFLDFFNYSGLMTSRPNRAGAKTNPLDRYRQNFKRVLADLVTAMQDSFARSDTLLDFSFSPLMLPLWQTALNFKGNTARSLNDAARLLVERKGVRDDQPVFSFINLMQTHMPYRPPQRFIGHFAPHVLHDKKAQRYLHRFNSDVFGWLAPLAEPLDEMNKKTLNGMYCAEVAFEDEQVGDFLAKLRAAGRLDHTLLIVAADHGEHLGEKRFIGHSLTAYEELVHVPLMIRDPRGDFPRSTNVDSFISTRRIFHTILDAASIATEDEQKFTLARNTYDDPDKGVVFAEAIPAANTLHLLERHAPQLMRERHCDLPRRAVFRWQHKLITTGDGQRELFDVFNDPGEENNLCAILPEQVEMMQDLLAAFLNGTDAAQLAAAPEDEFDDPEIERRLQDLGYLE